MYWYKTDTTYVAYVQYADFSAFSTVTHYCEDTM